MEVTKEQVALGIAVGISVIVAASWLTRKRLISEKAMLFWLVGSSLPLVLAIFPSALSGLAKLFGFTFASNAVFTFCMIFLVFHALFLTAKVTTLERQGRRLTQEVALLNERLSSGKP